MIRAKKEFGQNFLKDSFVLNKIIQSIPNDVQNLVEIGAGLGDLTRMLLKKAKLTSYEIDADLIKSLQSEFNGEIKRGDFRLINRDALVVWDENGLSDEPYFLCANLPYNAATKMILNALDDEKCSGFVVMVQREVAHKFCAKPKDSRYSSLAILCEINARAEVLFDVDPQAFVPSPKVVSSVIKASKKSDIFTYESGIFVNFDEYERFKRFLRVCFASPRKTLIKNLTAVFDKNLIKSIFETAQISSTIRSHESDCHFYIKIFKAIEAKNGRTQGKSE